MHQVVFRYPGKVAMLGPSRLPSLDLSSDTLLFPSSPLKVVFVLAYVHLAFARF